MSSRASRAFSVGLVSTVALAVIAFGVFLVGREQRFWEGRVEYWLQFTRTNGLQEGAPVLLDGVNVGSVTRMRFPPDPTARYVEVKIGVADDVAPRIRRDTSGRVQTLGLLGDKYVELTSGTLQAEPVEPDGLIRSIDPVDYEAILGQSGDIVSNVIEVTALLRQVLTDVNNGEGLVGRLVSDRDFGRDFADNLRTTVANLESATARIDGVLESVERGDGVLGTLLIEDTRLDEMIANMDVASRHVLAFSERLTNGGGALARLTADEEFAERTLTSIERASTSLAEISAKVSAGEGTLGKLVYDDRLYEDAHSLVGGNGGGLWRLLGRMLWPFGSVEPEAVEAGEPPAEARDRPGQRPQDRFRP